jgi:hypothetical protein
VADCCEYGDEPAGSGAKDLGSSVSVVSDFRLDDRPTWGPRFDPLKR